MTETEQRIAIAEACGIKCPFCMNTGKLPKWDNELYARYRQIDPSAALDQPEILCNHLGVPDYLHDLNAMFAAESGIVPAERNKYMLALWGVVSNPSKNPKLEPENWWKFLHASASQRAEAFLRTIGKWKD